MLLEPGFFVNFSPSITKTIPRLSKLHSPSTFGSRIRILGGLSASSHRHIPTINRMPPHPCQNMDRDDTAIAAVAGSNTVRLVNVIRRDILWLLIFLWHVPNLSSHKPDRAVFDASKITKNKLVVVVFELLSLSDPSGYYSHTKTN